MGLLLGCYLEEPITDKISSDTENNRVKCGASSMQGWRESQEDAHNCCIDYDGDIAYFGVYDGHGGAAVSKYAARELPSVLKKQAPYTEGDYETALKDAFMAFDATLWDPEVSKTLEKIIEEGKTEVKEEVEKLKAEADIPLDDLRAKYIKKSDEVSSSTEALSASSNDVESSECTSSKDKTTCEKPATNGPDSTSSESTEASSTINIIDLKSKLLKSLSQALMEAESEDSGDDFDQNQSDEDGSDEEGAEEVGDEEEAEEEESDEDIEDENESDEDVDGELEDKDGNKTKTIAKDCGCTAVVAVLTKDKVYVANAGDSRAVLCRNGKAVDLSTDHTPELPSEHSRIREAGGRVDSDGRVNGNLNLSRALGDLAYKKNKNIEPAKQIISAYPDIVIESIVEPENEFMILACDGIWNCVTSQGAVDFVRPLIDEGVPLSKICEKLFDTIIAKDANVNSVGADNMTMMIVQFKKENNGHLKRTAENDTEETNEQSKKKQKTQEEE